MAYYEGHAAHILLGILSLCVTSKIVLASVGHVRSCLCDNIIHTSIWAIYIYLVFCGSSRRSNVVSCKTNTRWQRIYFSTNIVPIFIPCNNFLHNYICLWPYILSYHTFKLITNVQNKQTWLNIHRYAIGNNFICQ